MQFTHSLGADPLLSKGGLIKTGQWSVGMWCHWNDDHRVDEWSVPSRCCIAHPLLGHSKGCVYSGGKFGGTGRIALEVKEREERGGKRGAGVVSC